MHKIPILAVLTCNTFESYHKDDDLCLNILNEKGLKTEYVIWDQTPFTPLYWQKYQAVLIRSTWDYYQTPNRLNHFLQVLKSIEEAGIALYNPLSLVKWNSCKKYLQVLAKKGVNTIATLWLNPQELNNLNSLLQDDIEYIIKPVVAAGGYKTLRFKREEILSVIQDYASFEGELMVQPFLHEIIREGELSFIFFDGEYSHSVRKLPKPENFLVQEINGGSVEVFQPNAKMIEEAKKMLQATEHSPLYARVDVVNKESSLLLMELEMIEPYLYLQYDKQASSRFADKILQKLKK